jgi:hypothetical protein
VFRNGLDLKIVPAPGPKPAAFEVQVARLVKSLHRIWLVNVYHRPGCGVAEFCYQLATLLDNLVDAGGHVICMGDFNCPGKAADTVDSSLEALLSCYGLTAVNSCPTHDDINKLDLIVENERPRLLSQATVTRVCYSDHFIVTVDLVISETPSKSVTYNCRSFNRIDLLAFSESLASSPSTMSPADDVDEFAEQIYADLLAAVDRHASMRMSRRRLPKANNRWLSTEAMVEKDRGMHMKPNTKL